MHQSLFFKLFPPPKFLVMKHAGLDISDDSIHCLEYSGNVPNLRISKFASLDMPSGIFDGGDIKDEKALGDLLSRFDHDHDLAYAKISIAEEKAYLFQTDISSTDTASIAQNIEFKLEENVPLAVADAIFYFDILPMTVTGGQLRASVSVVPRAYIENLTSILRNSGIFPIAFEIVPKSIAEAVLPYGDISTIMIVHIMNNKTGIYIVSGGVVCFTFTASWGSKAEKNIDSAGIQPLKAEINRIYDYWTSHNPSTSKIERIILVGHDSAKCEAEISKDAKDAGLSVSIANVWTNAFAVDSYIPPISREESLDYAVAAGLAMDL